VIVEARVLRPAPVLVLPVARHGDQHYGAEVQALPHSAGHLVTVHARESDVEENDFGALVPRPRAARPSRRGPSEPRAGEGKKFGEALRRIHVVIHDEKAVARRSGRLERLGLAHHVCPHRQRR